MHQALEKTLGMNALGDGEYVGDECIRGWGICLDGCIAGWRKFLGTDALRGGERFYG